MCSQRELESKANLLNRMATEASKGGFHNIGWGSIIQRELAAIGAELEEVKSLEDEEANDKAQ